MIPSLSTFAQGLGSVSADNLGTFEQTCDTFSQLRGLVGLSGMQVFCRGGDAVSDGAQGAFYWAAGATASDDDFYVISPVGAGVSGRWLRLPQTTPLTVSTLPAGQLGQGAFVRDSTVVAAGNFGNAVVGGGTNSLPVYYDGSLWRIG